MSKIEINKTYCKGCYLCLKACPLSLIEVGTESNVYGANYPVQVQAEKCVACGLCAVMCPDAAITVYK